MEIYQGKPIFYSLGTFFWQFDYERYDLFPDIQKAFKGLTGNPLHHQAVVLRMALSPKGKVKRIELLPIQLNDQGNPHLAFGQEGEPMLSQIQSLSQSLGTNVARKSWYAVVDVPKTAK
jgi:poly-gamma-glutamate capsule biosynthesis protein CapA/YwtB (metallophosphatase superfamily)